MGLGSTETETVKMTGKFRNYSACNQGKGEFEASSRSF